MEIRVITKPITLREVQDLAKNTYGTMVKGVVDVEKEIIALGGEFHRDVNDVIIDAGSKQGNVWGFNIYPFKQKDQWLEYNSLINIRPTLGNMSMDIEDENLCKVIRAIIERLVII